MSKIAKETPIGKLTADHIDDIRFAPGFFIDLWGKEQKYPKHLQPLCRIEYVEATNTIRVSVFADGDENAPVSVTDITLNESLIGVGVVDRGWGILEDNAGNRYVCDGDVAGHVKNMQTGELLQIYCRNSRGIPTSIGPSKAHNNE